MEGVGAISRCVDGENRELGNFVERIIRNEIYCIRKGKK